MKTSNGRVVAWLEKTITTFAPEFRKFGELAHGVSLLSPTCSSSGADVYRSMKEAQEGDIVLHFVDNEEIRAVSVVSAPFRTIEIGAIKHFAVALRDYRILTPSLNRNTLFSEPFRSELRSLLESGLKNTFFTREMKLAQGAYLTPVGKPLMQVFDKAYHTVAGRPILNSVEL